MQHVPRGGARRWTRTLLRARRSIHWTLKIVEAPARAIHAAERFAPSHPGRRPHVAQKGGHAPLAIVIETRAAASAVAFARKIHPVRAPPLA